MKKIAMNQGMKAKTTAMLCAIFAGVASLASGVASAEETSTRVYKYSDEARSSDWPSLIFETKGRTYFKIQKGGLIPKISAVSSCGEAVPVDQKLIEGYVVVPSVHEGYLLTGAGRQIAATYAGPKKITASDAPADFAQCAAKASHASSAAQILPAVAGKIEVVSPVSTKPATARPTFSVKISDGTIYGAMQRWSKVAGYQLSWEAERDFAVSLEATYQGDYESAVSQLMSSLDRSQYPLRACSFEDNRVIRIVHKSKSCKE